MSLQADASAPRWRRRVAGAAALLLASLAIGGTTASEYLYRDSDGDSLADCQERAGITAGGLTTPPLDPHRRDSDGDGVEDGDELHLIEQGSTKVTERLLAPLRCPSPPVRAWSDPTRADSDDDGLSDAHELSTGSDPWHGDIDEDGLSDAQELEWGTDEQRPDSDGDDRSDGDESRDGTSPLIADESIDDDSWAAEYARGAALGEFDDIDSVPALLGAMSGSAIGSVPVVGWVVSALSDARDAVAGAIDRDWASVLSSAAAVLPYAGDTAKISKQVTKFAAAHPDKVRSLARGVLSLEGLPESARMALLRAADERGVEGLRDAEISDATIIKFAKRGTLLATAVAGLASAQKVVLNIPSEHADNDGFATDLAAARDALAAYVGAAPDPRYVDVFPDDRFIGGRLFDACSDCNGEIGPGTTLMIASLAALHYSESVASQIDKDAYLVDQGINVEWHLYSGPEGWNVSEEVVEALTAADISYIAHVPGTGSAP